jgi:type IV pilus assembly protein PilX
MNARMSPNRARSRAAQRGFSLVTSLLLMLSVLLLGVASMGVNVMQERVIGNARDKDFALQVAEATLRDGETDVTNNITAASDFRADCNGGLCIPPSQRSPANAKPVEQQAGWDWNNAAKVRRLGQITGAPAFPGASASSPPVYVIERLGVLGTPPGESVKIGAEPSAPGWAFRITARAVGARPETETILQSIYATR